MAYFTTHIQLDMRQGFNFSSLLSGSVHRYTYNSFAVRSTGGYIDNLNGSGFTYGRGNIPTGTGILSSIWTEDPSGSWAVEFQFFRVSMRDVMDAAHTPSRADDLEIFMTILAGNDVVRGSDDSDVLDGFGGDDKLTGDNGNDVMYGQAGSDTIDGELGADTMSGGLGDDVYVVDHTSDRTIEAAGAGTDTVSARASYALGVAQSIELLVAAAPSSNAGISLSGNELGQKITGNNGANVIAGGAGNDSVRGFWGNDVLSGGAGNDSWRAAPDATRSSSTRRHRPATST